MLYRPAGGDKAISTTLGHFEVPLLSMEVSDDKEDQRRLKSDAPESGSMHAKKKCQIAGDFMFKMKLFLGFYIVGQLASILDGAQLLRTDIPRTDPILVFVHLVYSITVGGRGILLFSTFIFMADNGWKRTLSKLRSFYRQMVYAIDIELLERYGPKNRPIAFAKAEKRLGKEYVSILLNLMLKLLDETDLFADQRYRCVTYEACVSGSALLGHLESMGEGDGVRIENRQQALKVAEDLFDLGFIHHVTYEHVFKDSGLFYTYEERLVFRFPEDEALGQG